MNVRVFDNYRGDFVGCPRGRDVAGVVFSRSVEPRCDVRPISCVRFCQWVSGTGMVRCTIRRGFCYLFAWGEGVGVGRSTVLWGEESSISCEVRPLGAYGG